MSQRNIKIGTVEEHASLSDNLNTIQDNFTQAFNVLKDMNLFDKDAIDIESGKYINSVTGNPTANPDYVASGYICVTSEAEYWISTLSHIAWYDEDKVFISGNAATTYTNPATAPIGASYLRISIKTSEGQAIETTYVYDRQITGYYPYGPVINKEAITEVDGLSIETGSLPLNSLAFAEDGKNLFDKTTATSGFISQYNTVLESDLYYFSDYIQVEPGETYVGAGITNNIRFIAAYDSDKIISSSDGVSDASDTFTVPSGIYFVRLTIFTEDLDTFQFEKGVEATAYEPHEKILKGVTVATELSRWEGMSWASLGDSITYQNKWQPYVVNALGLVSNVYGEGGAQLIGAMASTTAICRETRISEIPTDTDLITVLAGTNDWAQNVPIGALGDTDGAATFHGGLYTLAVNLMSRFPDKRIVLMTTTYGELPEYEARGWGNAYTNTQGLTTRDYAQAVREAAEVWGFPVADLQAKCGWNTINIRTFINDDGGLLHPNNTGGERIANVVVGCLSNIGPLA